MDVCTYPAIHLSIPAVVFPIVRLWMGRNILPRSLASAGRAFGGVKAIAHNGGPDHLLMGEGSPFSHALAIYKPAGIGLLSLVSARGTSRADWQLFGTVSPSVWTDEMPIVEGGRARDMASCKWRKFTLVCNEGIVPETETRETLQNPFLPITWSPLEGCRGDEESMPF